MGHLKEITSFKRRELSYELGKEGPNNYGIIFKGEKKFWKVVSSKKLADRMVATLKRRGKDADVLQTAAQTTEESGYPHKMYDPKTGKTHVAKTPEDHERMSKLGYTNDDPEKEESVKVRKNKTGMMGSKTQVHKDKKKELSKTVGRKKVSVDEKVDYLTLNQIKKEWSKEYPGTKFKFQVSKYKGMERLSVLSPKGAELEVYDKVPGQGWTIQETTDLDENDRAKLAALYNKALKHMPHSPAQNRIRKEIEALRKKLKIDEGVDDPAIFKVVFLAGGPGSGKSFTVGKTGLSSLGFRVVNSDDIFEFSLKKAGLDTTQKDIYSPKGQKIRQGAKKLTAKKMDLYLNGRLGLVIDGTGKDYTKIQKWAVSLKEIGYDIGMIFVNTNLETAISRDRGRGERGGRTLGDKKVTKMWQEVQDNLGKFQRLFREAFVIVDNSEGANYEKATLNAYKKMSKFAKTPPKNPIAKKWIKDAGGRLKEGIVGNLLKKGFKRFGTSKGRADAAKKKHDKAKEKVARKLAPFDRGIDKIDDQIKDLEDAISDINDTNKEEGEKIDDQIKGLKAEKEKLQPAEDSEGKKEEMSDKDKKRSKEITAEIKKLKDSKMSDEDKETSKKIREKIQSLKVQKRKAKDKKREQKNKLLGIKDSYSMDLLRKISMVECVLGDEELKLQIAESITVESKPSEIKHIFKTLRRKYENDKRRN